MGNLCARDDGEESATRTIYALGPDYAELDDQTVGEGVKQTKAWKASITRPQLERKREEFWKKQTSGRRRVWYTIRTAVEADYLTAATLLAAAEITLVNDSITHCKDSDGLLYEVPLFVINNPVEFFTKKKRKTKVKPPIEEVVNLKIRRPGKEVDIELQIESERTVQEMKGKYSELEGIEQDKIRLFFAGKEMKDEQNIAFYEVRSTMVVQAFVKG